MKKLFAIFTAAAISVSAFAQDNQIFNHLAVGPTIGFDGLGVEVVTTLTPIVQIHAGYSMLIPPSVTIPGSSLSMIPETVNINGDVRQLRSEVSATAKFNFGAPKLLFDIFPGKNTPFHFTVGAYFANPALLGVDVNMSKVLRQDEYASYYIELQENNINSRISSDKNGIIRADVVGNVVRPYVGIGFGRAINPSRRVGVTFDMGVVYWGSGKLQSYDYTLNDAGRPVVITSEMLNKQDQGIIDTVSSIPVLPVMKLNVIIRIF